MPRPLQIGTRDTCRHCGQKIILLSEEGRSFRSFERWQHMLPNGGHKLECAPRFQDGKRGRHGLDVRAEPASYCWESVNTDSAWHSAMCQRPVKDKELFMCGIHANHVKKAQARDAAWTERWELNQFMAEGMQRVCDHLKTEFGLECTPVVSRGHADILGRYTGEVEVDATKLLDLLTEMRDEERF